MSFYKRHHSLFMIHMMLWTLLIPVVLRMPIIHERFMWPTILDKTVEKIAYLGGIFSKLRSRPIIPSPLPLKAVLLGLQKKAASLSICRKQL